MTIKIVNFEVSAGNDAAELAFGLRIVVINYLREQFASKLAGAEDAGVDKVTALRKFSLTYAKAAKGYRLPRAILPSQVQWAGYAEYHKGRDGFPAPALNTAGTFDREALRALPGGVILVRLGGVEFVGTTTEPIANDVFEIRIAKTGRTYLCSLLSGRFDDGSAVAIDVPSAPETIDA